MGLGNGRSLAALAAAIATACAARPPEPPPAAQKTATPRPLLEMRASRIVGTDPQGQRVWEVEAESVTVDEVERRARLSRPRGVFFAEGGPVRFEAASAEYGVQGGWIELVGSVRIVAAPDRWLRAEQARYEGRRLSARRVEFRWGRISARADRLEADVTLRRARLAGNVRLEAVR